MLTKFIRPTNSTSSASVSRVWASRFAATFWSGSRFTTGYADQAIDSYGSWSNNGLHQCAHGFASRAEEFDLITGDDELARISGHDARGFLVNNKYLPGSVLCSGKLATLWAADSYEAITPESLSLLLLMRPPPDLLVLGCGPRMLPPPPVVQKWLASHGVTMECLSTVNASSTFNILNQEGRAVVGAFLPCD